MISTEVLPQELHKLDFLLGLKRDKLTRNQAQQYDLREEENLIKREIEEIENNKYRLLTGRNI